MWITLTTYGTNRPTKVRPEVIKAMSESEWGSTLYLADGDKISVTENVETVCALIEGKKR